MGHYRHGGGHRRMCRWLSGRRPRVSQEQEQGSHGKGGRPCRTASNAFAGASDDALYAAAFDDGRYPAGYTKRSLSYQYRYLAGHSAILWRSLGCGFSGEAPTRDSPRTSDVAESAVPAQDIAGPHGSGEYAGCARQTDLSSHDCPTGQRRVSRHRLACVPYNGVLVAQHAT